MCESLCLPKMPLCCVPEAYEKDSVVLDVGVSKNQGYSIWTQNRGTPRIIDNTNYKRLRVISKGIAGRFPA